MTCSLSSGSKSIFPAVSGEDGGVVLGGLSVEIELGGPPGFDAVFQFKIRAEEKITGVADHVKALDFQIAGLFHLVGVGDEVGALLGVEASAKAYDRKEREENLQRTQRRRCVATELHL